MVDKSFEHVIHFHQVSTPAGIFRIPLVTVFLIQPNGTRIQLPLIFDTGADVTTLRHDLFPLLGLTAWNVGTHRQTNTAGGAQPVDTYEYTARLEFLNKTADCAIQLAILPSNPLYLGLFGRAQMFQEFGFGFWEKDSALYVTESP